MTDKPTDEDINDSTPQESQVEDEAEIIDDDPMIAEMKEAEAEIKAQEEASSEGGEEPDPDNPEGDNDGEGGTKPEEGAKPEDEKAHKPITVPKARLDEVLSERDLLRDQIGYLQGLNDAKDQQAAKAPQGTGSEGTDQKPGEDQEGSEKVDPIDAAINDAEQKKLELAAKYDEGEISTVEMTKAQIEVDKDIRELSKQRLEQSSEKVAAESKAHTEAVLNAQQQEDYLDDRAVEIQQTHPNIAVIDASSVSKSIWDNLNNEAAQNLSQRGVNVNDGSLQTRLALIQEKAALTQSDKYSPESLKSFLPDGYTQPSNQQQADSQDEGGQRKPSEAALNRGKKLELADTQPPKVGDMGAGKTGEVTDQDIENMSEDQVADMLQKMPQLGDRILGNSAT